MLMITTVQTASIWNVGIKTAAAQNLVAVGFVERTLHHTITWVKWFIAAAPFVALMSVALYFVMIWMMPPEVRDVPGGREGIRASLTELGPMKASEKKLLAISLTLLAFWVHRGRAAFLLTVVARSPYAEMKAAAWEKEDVRRESIAIRDGLVPKEVIVDDGRVTAMMFQPVRAVYEDGRRRLVPTGAAPEPFPCDDVILAIGQEPAFPWIERGLGIAFDAQGQCRRCTRRRSSRAMRRFSSAATQPSGLGTSSRRSPMGTRPPSPSTAT
jgi:hypothetical protein